MELREHVKNYIEQNIDLLDKDSLSFIQEYMTYGSGARKEDMSQFMEIVTNTLGLLSDLDSVVTRAKTALQRECQIIENKYDVAGIAGTIKLNDTINDINISTIAEHSLNNLQVSSVKDGRVPHHLPAEYMFKVDDGYLETKIQLIQNKVPSAVVKVNKIRQLFRLQDLYSGSFIQLFIPKYDQLCRELREAIDTCINSFIWRRSIEEEIAPKLQEMLNDICEDLFGEKLYHISTGTKDNVVYVKVPDAIQKQTKIRLNVELYFDKDPSSINIDQLATIMEHHLINFKTVYEKKQTRAAERVSKGLVEVTRRDVTAAIKAAGFVPSNHVYTNKYVNSTTYKYQFMNLTPQECKLVEDELRKINADVISVTTETSYGGRGAYNSLFVKVRN